jgi:TonB family protein
MMKNAIAILIAASLIAAAPHAVASQEPSPSPATSPASVKIAGRDVPAPKRRTFVSPIFPPEAQAAGQRGIVILELLIDESGKVSTADVVRSVPPFDDAALAAARQWEYEVTKVDGKAVPVRLTVPITFALKLPELTREAGIPELRQGAAPAFPLGVKGSGKVVADVTLLPDGSVAEAAIREGDSPWAEVLLQTLRTWRFTSDPEGGAVAFEVRADFQQGPPPKVDLKLSGLHAGARHAAVTPSTPAPASVPPPPEASPAATPTPAAVPAAAPTPAPATPTVTAAAPTATPGPASSAAGPASSTASSGSTASTIAPPPPVAMPSPGALPHPTGLSTPPPVQTPPAAPSPLPGAVPSSSTPTPPPVEVIPGGPPAPVPAGPGGVPPGASAPAVGAPPRVEAGVSAVRDVSLGAGVPDLTKGRRPVAPPLARMSSVSGSVQIQFSVDASGASSIQNVSGPDLLKEAARQAVSSWSFRRTTAERLYLVAVFQYDGDRAQADVRKAE